MKRKKYLTSIFKGFILFCGLYFIGLVFWTQKNFGVVTLDQTLSTLSLGLGGAFSPSSVYFKRFILWCIAIPLIITFIYLIVEKRYSKTAFIPIIVFFIGISYACNQYSIVQFFNKTIHQPKTDYFQTHYIDANKIAFKTIHAKSLIFIYIESLEATYSDPNLFGHDLLHALNQLNVPKITFKHFLQMPGTGWTAAGIISTQCGIPLKLITVFDGNTIGKHITNFLPGATCMSDILAKHGYKNVFMKGAFLRFAGIGNFLESHHYTETYGKEHWLTNGYSKSEMNEWGLSDDELFKNAKIKLAKLIKEKQLFNLSILTVDTHGITGFLNKTCKARGFRDFEGIVECTSDQVAEFVNYVKTQGWLDKVNIVIIGDHLAMGNAVSEKIDRNPSRSIFNIIISKEVMAKNTDTIVGFDLFPTVLALLGFQFDGNRLGLGYSAIAKNKAPADRISEMEKQIDYNSKRYNRFWVAER